MSLSQLIATTIMQFRADTSQARAEIKALQGAEKAAAEETVKSIEKRNAGYESLAKGITKVNAVLGIANEVLRVGGEAFKAYEENQRLSIAAANVSIGALRSSSQGLRTDLDLLKLAAAGNAATFKSTQSQLENAAAAMVAFERAGFDAAQSTEKVREAILNGNIGPLKALGVNLDMAKTKQEQFAQLQTVLAQKAREAGDAHAGAGEAFKRASVEYDNAMRSIKIALGELVAGLAPLISALAKVAGLVADVVSAAGSAVGSIHAGMSITDDLKKMIKGYITPEMAALIAGREDAYRARSAEGTARFNSDREADDAPRGYGRQSQALQEYGRRQRRMRGRKSGGGGEYYFGGVDNQDYVAPGSQYYGSVENRTDTAGRPIGFSTDLGGGSFGGGLADAPGAGFGGSADALAKLAAEFNHVGTQSMLSKAFGPISEFDAYAKAFSTLTGSLEAGFSAWIDGSMSAGAAIKKFFADSIKAMASEMFAKAIQHGAYALGSLAFGDMKGAATHGLAAAKFGAGAVAIGALAKTMGGGSAGAGASGGGAPNVTGGGGSSRPVTSSAPINVYVGDVFADDNPRARAGRVQRAVRMATRGSSNVTWDN